MLNSASTPSPLARTAAPTPSPLAGEGWGGRAWLLSIAGGISLLSLFIAVSVSEAGKLRGAFWPVAPTFLIWTALALAASYGLRAWRLAVIMNIPRSLGITQVALLHNLLNALLPAKLGELSLPVLIRRYQGHGLAKGLGVLVVVRALDVLGLLGWCSVLLLVHPPLWDGSGSLFGLAGLSITVGLLAVLVGMGGYFRRQPPANLSLGRWPKIRRLWQDLGAGLAGLSYTRLGYAMLLSVLIWILIAAAFHSAALAFGITAPFAMTTLATASATLAFMLPINGLASLGPPQLAWAGVLAALGSRWEHSLAAATVTQLMALAVMGGLVASVAVGMAWRARHTGERG